MKTAFLFSLLASLLFSSPLWAQSNIDRLEKRLPETKGIERLKALNTLAAMYLTTSVGKTLGYADETLSRAANMKENLSPSDPLYTGIVRCEADALNYKGLAYENQGETGKAVRQYRQAFRLANEVGYEAGQQQAQDRLEANGKKVGMINPGKWVKSTLGDIGKWLEEDVGPKVKEGTREVIMGLGERAEENENYEQAIKHYEEAAGMYLVDGDTTQTITIYQHIGTLFQLLNKNQEAESFYALASDLSAGMSLKEASTQPRGTEFKDVLADAKESQEPQVALSKEEEKANQEAQKSFLKEAENLARKGQYKESYEYLKQSAFLQKQLAQAQEIRLRDSIETASALQEIALLKQQQEIRNQEMRRNRQFRNSLIISLLLILAIAGLLMYLFFTKRKAHTKLSQTYTQLEDTHKELKSTQTQLVAAEKMASLGQLTAGIAHEINNPINFISGNVNPLKEDINEILTLLNAYDQAVKEKQLAHQFAEIQGMKSYEDLDYVKEEIQLLLEGINEGANRTTEIVRGLRNFARLDEEEVKPFDVHEGLDSTLALLKNHTKGIEVIKEYGAIPQIEGFPGKINQVFMNVLTNACQAMPEGGKIHLYTHAHKDHVEIRIHDTGCGIPPEIQKRIFEPFFTTKDVGAGTGLGLSISHGIIEQHHGTIDVKSVVGEGTEIVIVLPIRQKSAVV